MLIELLADRRTSILKRWLGLILESYPAAQFLLTEKDRFSIPSGRQSPARSRSSSTE